MVPRQATQSVMFLQTLAEPLAHWTTCDRLCLISSLISRKNISDQFLHLGALAFSFISSCWSRGSHKFAGMLLGMPWMVFVVIPVGNVVWLCWISLEVGSTSFLKGPSLSFSLPHTLVHTNLCLLILKYSLMCHTVRGWRGTVYQIVSGPWAVHSTHPPENDVWITLGSQHLGTKLWRKKKERARKRQST